MATFSVILEDSTKKRFGHISTFILGNQRVVTIDAKSLDDAWHLARAKYYINRKAIADDDPDTQIVDIKAGAIELP
jgi:hypothetical protein